MAEYRVIVDWITHPPGKILNHLTIQLLLAFSCTYRIELTKNHRLWMEVFAVRQLMQRSVQLFGGDVGILQQYDFIGEEAFRLAKVLASDISPSVVERGKYALADLERRK